MGREDEIRLIAYGIWEEEGCPNGRDCEHWVRAEAIWEQNGKPETSTKGIRTASKQTSKPTDKVGTAKKKTKNT